MDANQRSEMNNQTNNGGNEKWNENAKGKTAPDAPLDHTYPNGASLQQQGALFLWCLRKLSCCTIWG